MRVSQSVFLDSHSLQSTSRMCCQRPEGKVWSHFNTKQVYEDTQYCSHGPQHVNDTAKSCLLFGSGLHATAVARLTPSKWWVGEYMERVGWVGWGGAWSIWPCLNCAVAKNSRYTRDGTPLCRVGPTFGVLCCLLQKNAQKLSHSSLSVESDQNARKMKSDANLELFVKV